jgi:CrcB protein
VGFLGAFTTYSTLAVDVDVLLRDGYALVAVAYAVASVVVGFAASTVGIWTAAAHHRGSAR